MQLLEDPDNADVGDAASATTRQDEDELWLFFDRFLGRYGSDQREHEDCDDGNPDWTGIHGVSRVFRG